MKMRNVKGLWPIDPIVIFFRQTGIVSDGEGMQIMLKDWTPAELSLGTG